MYGNYLLGAALLMLRLRTHRVRAIRCRGHLVPHFVVTDSRRRSWHFRRVRDVLPYPLCYLLFIGQFARWFPLPADEEK